MEPKNPPWQLWTINIDSIEKFNTNIPFSEQDGSGWEHCEVQLNSSWYLGCDGSPLTSTQYLNKMKELFALAVRSSDQGPHWFALSVRNKCSIEH